MKDMRKLSKIIFLVSVGMLCCAFAGCIGDTGSSESSFSSSEANSSTGASSSSEEVKSLTLNEEEISVNVYDNFTLETTLVGLSGDVSWTSSDNDVVVVENGRIFAVETGTATITAELNGYEDTCSVTVNNDLMRMPTLVLDETELAIEKRKEYTVSADMLYKGVSLPKDYEYVWSVGADSEGIVSITSVSGTNGSQVTIKGLTVGTAECYVKVNAVGKEIVEVVNVTVLPPVPAIFLTNFSQEQGEYSIDLSTIDANEGADVSTVIPAITVVDDEETVENPALTWGGGEDEIAVLEDNTIKAVGVGTTTFTLTYKSVTVNVKVNVYRPTIAIDETLEFESVLSQIDYNTSTLIGTGEKVYLNDQEIGEIADQAIEYDLSNATYALGEETTAELWTDKVIYAYKAVVYTKIIRTTAEFGKIKDYDSVGVSLGGYTYRQGYYVLGADLNFGGKAPTVCNFMGTFDGRGHTISNMSLQKAGLFGYLRESAVIKNVIIKSTELDVSGNAGVVARQAYNGFTISNVYAEVKYIGTIATSGSFGAGFVGQKIYSGYAEEHSIEDCVMLVDVSGLTADGKATAACFVGFVQHNPTLCAEGKVHQSSEIFNLNNSIAVVVGENNGYTVSDYYGTQSFTAATVSDYVYPVVENSCVLRTLEAYEEWLEAAESDTSVYKETAVQFVKEYVQAQWLTVALETEGHPDVNMHDKTASITLTDLVLKGANGDKLDLSNKVVTSLKVGDKELLGDIASISAEGVLTLTASTAHLVNELGTYRGQTYFMLTASEGSGATEKVYVYKIPVTLADYVFTTIDQLRAFGSTDSTTGILVENVNTVGSWNPASASTAVIGTNGYFVLGKDIVASNKNIASTKVGLYGGTFDGQGYSITGATFYQTAMFEYLRDGAVVKDFTITGKVDGETSSIIARFTGRGFTISNVYVNVNLNKNFANKRLGLIGRTQDNYSAGTQNMKALIEDCAMVVSIAGLTGTPSTESGIWVGTTGCPYGVMGDHSKCTQTNCKGDYPVLTMTNCISVVKDTNESGYSVPTFGSTFYKDGLTENNCKYFASWTEYDEATLSGYSADMLDFINDCKA